jgi:hypothetical protein
MIVRLSALSLAVIAAAILAEGCGAKPGAAGTAPDKAQLIAGSWRCQAPGGPSMPPEFTEILFNYDATFLSDGAFRQTGLVRATFDRKPLEMQLIFRGKWSLKGDRIRQEFDYQGATMLKVDGEIIDHSHINKTFIDEITRDPSIKTYEVLLTKVDDRELVFETSDRELTMCSRAG